MLGPLRLMGLRRAATPLLLLLLAVCGSTVPLQVEAVTTDSENLSAVSTTSPAGSTTCKRLTDADSPFLSGIALLASLGGPSVKFLADPAAFDALDRALPTLSQCVAQTQPLALLSSLMLSQVSSTRALQCWSALSSLPSTQLVDANGTILFGETVCPAFTTLAPCLTDVLLPEIERAMANSGSCCDGLSAQISGWFGASLRDAVTSSVHVAGNALCSQHSSIAEPSKSESCGDSLQRNWQPPTNGDDERAYWNLLNGFQIPNDQVCKAARSERVTTTMNQTQQFGAPDIAPYSSCYTPMDAFQQYVRALPFWRVAGGADAAALIERAFVADSCLPGKDLLQWAADDDAAFMKGVRVVDDVLTTLSTVFGVSVTNTTSPTVTPSPTTAKPTPAPTATKEPNASSDGSGSNDDGSNGEKREDEKPGVFDPVEQTDGEDGPTLEDLAGANLTELVRTKLWELNLVAEQLCFHIPNGVSCSFSGDVLTAPFPQLEPLTAATVPPGPVASAVNSSTTNSSATSSKSSTTNNSSSAASTRHQRHDSMLSMAVTISSAAALFVAQLL